MRGRTSSIAVAILAALAAGCATAPQFTAQDETVVREMFDSAVMWIRSANYAAWAGQFAEAAVFLPPDGPAVTGRVAIRAWAEQMPKVDELDFSNVEVRGEGNFAWGTSRIVLKYAGMPAADTAKQLVVFHRDPMASWQVVALSFNSNLPPQPAGAMPRR